MRSKNNKRRPAARREGKLALFLKRAGIFLSIAALVTIIVFSTYWMAQAFYVRDIEVSGNGHLTRGDIKDIINIGRGESLFNLSLSEIDRRLKSSAWVRKTYLRWQLPGTLIINIEEAAPKALLNFGGEMFLVNEYGDIMEKLQGVVTPFLPVIKEVDPRFKKNMSEAMKLIGTLTAKNITSDKQFLEVGMDSYGFTVNIDGEFIKVGYGRYSEKFEKWMELEPELKKRGVPIQYVDLRFKDSVIVKPVIPEKEKDKDKDKVKDKKKEKKI